MLHIVLVAPEIPQNTGTIGRLCVCTDAHLHLVEPLGFSLDESRIRRAGLDYWQYLALTVYRSWNEFLGKNPTRRLLFASTRGCRNLFDVSFRDEDALVFGNESSGLPAPFYERYRDDLFTIPMPGMHARSHNLANAASVVLYEALRQVHWSTATGSLDTGPTRT